jgi:hypothetical protein
MITLRDVEGYRFEESPPRKPRPITNGQRPHRQRHRKLSPATPGGTGDDQHRPADLQRAYLTLDLQPG